MPDRPNVFTYPRQEPGTQGHLDLVEPLRAMPSDLAGELKGILPADAQRRPESGGWCIQEIVGHLADAAQIYHKRLYMMSTQTDPILEPYDPDALATEHAYMDGELGEMQARIAHWRGETVELLTTLVNWNWARSGQHLERGRTSIRQLVEHMIEHEAEHLEDIRHLRADT